MSNILIIRVIESRTLGEEFVEYEVRVSDNHHETTLGSFDTLPKLYQAYASNFDLVHAVSVLEEFEGLYFNADEDDQITIDEDAPYSGISIEGFNPVVQLTCNGGHPLVFMAENSFSTTLLFSDDAGPDVLRFDNVVNESVTCVNPDCTESIHRDARIRVLEEGRAFHKTNPLHR